MKCETISFVEGDEDFIEEKIDTITDSIVPSGEGSVPGCTVGGRKIPRRLYAGTFRKDIAAVY